VPTAWVSVINRAHTKFASLDPIVPTSTVITADDKLQESSETLLLPHAHEREV